MGLLTDLLGDGNATSDVVGVVDAGTNLSAARHATAAATYWRFDAGVDTGTDGDAIVNGQPGDLIFVASA